MSPTIYVFVFTNQIGDDTTRLEKMYFMMDSKMDIEVIAIGGLVNFF